MYDQKMARTSQRVGSKSARNVTIVSEVARNNDQPVWHQLNQKKPQSPNSSKFKHTINQAKQTLPYLYCWRYLSSSTIRPVTNAAQVHSFALRRARNCSRDRWVWSPSQGYRCEQLSKGNSPQKWTKLTPKRKKIEPKIEVKYVTRHPLVVLT